jgi:hypothetical protein
MMVKDRVLRVISSKLGILGIGYTDIKRQKKVPLDSWSLYLLFHQITVL